MDDRATVVDETQVPAHTPTTRLEGLDLLRGLCALGVAIYHLRMWSDAPISPFTAGILSVLGVYGVSAFFILSGFSLAHAYGRGFDGSLTEQRVSRYFRRRAGRLLPLFTGVVLVSIAGRIVSGGNVPDIYTALASILLVFGLVDAANTPVIGGWSIGVEAAFYVIFPLIILLKRYQTAIFAISILLTAWISYDLSAFGNIDEGWRAYVAPANQFIFFCGGVLMRQKIDPARRQLGSWPFAAVTALIVVIACASALDGDLLAIVTGWRRGVFIILSLTLVACFAYVRPWKTVSQLSSLSGGMSYPLYLIHPLLFFAANRFLPGGWLGVMILLVASIILALAIELLFERPTQRQLKSRGW